MKRFWLMLLFLPITAVLVVSFPGTGHSKSQIQDSGNLFWTEWDIAHHTLLEDSEGVWIGTGSGLIFLPENQGQRERIAPADGFPHQHVYTAALAPNGDRWFGGDGGLSKLDAHGVWSHETTDSSGLVSNLVTGIALDNQEGVWLMYGDTQRLSVRHPDGSWQRYPNRETAVTLQFKTIRETINQNDLWAVAGGEVWVGFDAFDGAIWYDRRPSPDDGSPIKTVVDGRESIWMLANQFEVVHWDGQAWSSFAYDTFDFDGQLETLVVDKQGNVWAGGYRIPTPYGGGYAAIGRLPAQPGSIELDQPVAGSPNLSALLATDSGIWAAGDNWINQPGAGFYQFDDVPYLEPVRWVLVDGQDSRWVYSSDNQSGVIQILDDRGTATLDDDQGTAVEFPADITAREIAANGDLWLASAAWHRFLEIDPLRRYHQGARLVIDMPKKDAYIYDIFAEDAARTWFLYDIKDVFGETLESGIWSLDDGGTPADPHDDTWMAFAVGELHPRTIAARDGELWAGGDAGIFRYHAGAWQQLSEAPAFDLIPAADGALFVDERQPGELLFINGNGGQERCSVANLVANHFSLLISTTHRNNLWRVAPDGSIWYWRNSYTLVQDDGTDWREFDSPVKDGPIEIDGHYHLWLVGDHHLWRLSPRAGFALSTVPVWFIRSTDTRVANVAVIPQGGFDGLVTLAIEGLPPGATALIAPEAVPAGEAATINLTTDHVALGEVSLILSGSSGERVDRQAVILAIVEQVDTARLPAIYR